MVMVFVVWFTDNKRLAWFLALTIVMSPYHLNLRPPRARFEPAWNLRVPVLWDEVV